MRVLSWLFDHVYRKDVFHSIKSGNYTKITKYKDKQREKIVDVQMFSVLNFKSFEEAKMKYNNTTRAFLT